MKFDRTDISGSAYPFEVKTSFPVTSSEENLERIPVHLHIYKKNFHGEYVHFCSQTDVTKLTLVSIPSDLLKVLG